MNSMQMPQQPQPMQGAGLGAMLQAKGSAGAGASKESMNEMMEKARGLPDSELADVLAGRSVRVPQFAAMLAAMGRESLRTAVAGAQAGAVKQPSERDKLLAKMSGQGAGLSALPSANMEQMGEGMAGGGIVAFNGEKGSDVNDRRSPADRALDALIARINSSANGNVVIPSASNTGVAGAVPEAFPVDGVSPEFGGSTITAAEDEARIAKIKADRAAIEDAQRQAFLRTAAPQMAAPSAAPQGSLTEGITPASVAASEAQLPKATAGKIAPGGTPAPKAGIDALAPNRAEAPAGRKSPIDDLLSPVDEIAKQVASGKNQAQGEFLMTLGASILSRPNLGVALGQGIKEGLPGLAANRKEANMLLKDQRDYNLNLAKAKEAAAQGRDDLAFKYADLAEKAKYHAGVIGVGMARAGAANTFGPKQYQAAMSNAQKEVDNYINKLGPLEKRRMTPETRQQMLDAAFNRNIQAYQSGVMPAAPDSRVVNELPQGGTLLSRD